MAKPHKKQAVDREKDATESTEVTVDSSAVYRHYLSTVYVEFRLFVYNIDPLCNSWDRAKVPAELAND